MKLDEFLRSQEMSAADFGSLIGVGSKATVYRYIQGIRFPSVSVLHRIREATGGKVTADDFVVAHHDRLSTPTKEGADQ